MKRSRSVALAAAAAFVLVACSEAPTGTPPVEELTVELDARGGNGGGGGGGGGGSATDPTATFVLPSAGAALLSDGNGDYVNGSCGVEAKIFATEAASNSGDATLNTKKGKCIRTVRIVFGDGDEEQVRVFINVNNIHNTTTVIPLNGTVTRGMNINPWSGSRCETLLLRNTLQDGTPLPEGNPVKVTRTAADTWHVYNEIGANSAACQQIDGTYTSVTLPVDFEIVSSAELASS